VRRCLERASGAGTQDRRSGSASFEGHQVQIAMVSVEDDPLAGTEARMGGARRVHVRELAQELGARGHEVTIYTRRVDPEADRRVAMDPGVTVEYVEAGPATVAVSKLVWRFHPRFVANLRAALQRRTPAVIHSHGWLSGAAALEAANGTIPIVHSFHGLGAVERRHRRGSGSGPPERLTIERLIARSVDLVVASCVDEQRELLALGAPPSRVEVVPSGVDTTRFRHHGGSLARSRPESVLCLGGLAPDKGVDVAVQALRHVPDASLLVVGGPPPEDLPTDPDVARLRAVASHHLVDDRVTFQGSIPHDDVPALLRSADVVVATPWHEGFGRVSVEAMACGTPVVASSVGGMLDTVQHGRTGVLVPARDPLAVAGALKYLLDNPVLRRRMGTSASAWVNDRYSWERVVDDLLERYRAVDRQNLQAVAT
jgi:D-inositol-3-phosphate glycosyltransferase